MSHDIGDLNELRYNSKLFAINENFYERMLFVIFFICLVTNNLFCGDIFMLCVEKKIYIIYDIYILYLEIYLVNDSFKIMYTIPSRLCHTSIYRYVLKFDIFDLIYRNIVCIFKNI